MCVCIHIHIFPIWPIAELPNFMFSKYLTEYQNVKIVKSNFKTLKRSEVRKTNIKSM